MLSHRRSLAALFRAAFGLERQDTFRGVAVSDKPKSDRGVLPGETAGFFATVQPVRMGDIWINRPYLDILNANGLNRFEAFWRFSEGELIKQIKTRSVRRFSLNSTGGQRHFYLKRHLREWSGWPLSGCPCFSSISRSQGLVEFDHCALFRRSGLATAHPVAAGERRAHGFWVESFFVTEDFTPFVSLEELIRERPSLFEGPDGRRVKNAWLGHIARTARRMHACGFHHLDFNATHILIHCPEPSAEKPQIGFFDLQRVSKTRLFRWRWIIKGLARLIQTLPPHLFSEADRQHLFLSYKGRSRLDFWSRIQWWWLKRKSERIKRHTQKIDKIKQWQRAQLGKIKK
ncbi:MAG: lipopolysaccharide kinase InaA family protein [Desulfobacterales bacterium]